MIRKQELVATTAHHPAQHGGFASAISLARSALSWGKIPIPRCSLHKSAGYSCPCEPHLYNRTVPGTTRKPPSSRPRTAPPPKVRKKSDARPRRVVDRKST